MTKTEYLAQLEKHLKKLPHKEFQEALTFFHEYFDEAGPDQEERIMEELGTPKEAASELINNILDRHIQGEDDEVAAEKVALGKRHLYTLIGIGICLLFSFFLVFVFHSLLGVLTFFLLSCFAAFYIGKNWQEIRETKKTVWLSTLAIISLPIAIPALFFLIGGLLFLILLIIGFLLAGVISGLAAFIASFYFIWEAFTLLTQGGHVFLMGLGIGLCLFGGAVLLYLLTGFFAYWAWQFVKFCFHWILKRGKRA
ncbi:DUF1700 domain-containing protein [Streptococcus gallolyticus]|nr:DUF1700 domain-containing protein [Streptococcus gallolyticus]MBY5040533.1 DUF1700 domain-containing protein [Streptococcus gallolyticus]